MSDDRDENGELRAKREKKIRDAIVRPLFGDKAITTTHALGLDTCFHDFVTLIRGTMGEAKEVRCRVCKEKLDPILVLEKLARAWDNVTYAESELSRLRAQRDELKREASNAKARTRNARKLADNPRADEYFEELLAKINAAKSRHDGHEIRVWERQFKWLEAHHYAELVEAWRQAERRFEDEERRRGKLRRRGLKEIAGGAAEKPEAHE